MTFSSPAAFDSLPLSPALQANLQSLGYLSMTPIQAAALPLALAGHDLIAQAQTGSGKTAAFGLALLNRLDPRVPDVQAMVLCPTRELADQVTQEIRRLARQEGNIKVLSLCGGSTMRPQIESLAHGAHIVVGTPGRLMDHLERGTLHLGGLRTLVLDEADRMLDMGFHDDMVTVTSQCPRDRQTLLFSATYPDDIAKLSARFLRNPKEVKVAGAPEARQIEERWYEVERETRLDAVTTLLLAERPVSAIAFCNTRQQCRDLVDVLTAHGIEALALHGELEQRERDQVLIQFANRSATVLVATDVAARGLDIAQLEVVINVDVTPDSEVHIHRIGRTGRAGASGLALNLASMNEMGRVAQIEVLQKKQSTWFKLDEVKPASSEPLLPQMVTIQILGGRKEKMRPGDVLGALTGEAGYTSSQIGKINITDFHTYVAVEHGIGRQAVAKLNDVVKVKGKRVKARLMGPADLPH
jgi:ATP-independent RNA helicase DbpA